MKQTASHRSFDAHADRILALIDETLQDDAKGNSPKRPLYSSPCDMEADDLNLTPYPYPQPSKEESGIREAKTAIARILPLKRSA